MGIYDRDYARAGGGGEGERVRFGPRSASGLGRLRFVSFNTWIIAINIAVFVIDAMLAGRGIPVLMASDIDDARVPSREIVYSATFFDATGQQVPPQFAHRAGLQLYSPAIDRRSGQVVGRGIFQIMHPLAAYGHFSTFEGFFRLQVWRLVTFQFLHDHSTITHLLFNMFGLWVFGGMVEQALGFKRYAAFYLTCGIFGGLTYLLLNLLGTTFQVSWLPGVLFNEIRTPLIGASAGVFGVIMACAYIAPNAIVQLLFPPIPLRMKVMAYGYVAIAAFSLLRGSANAGGEAAHIGGAVAGFFFIRNAHLLRDFFDIFGDSRRPKAAGRGAGPPRAPRPPPGGRSPGRSPDGDIDRILAKVNERGLASLSEAEKRTLRQATEDRRAGS